MGKKNGGGGCGWSTNKRKEGGGQKAIGYTPWGKKGKKSTHLERKKKGGKNEKTKAKKPGKKKKLSQKYTRGTPTK